MNEVANPARGVRSISGTWKMGRLMGSLWGSNEKSRARHLAVKPVPRLAAEQQVPLSVSNLISGFSYCVQDVRHITVPILRVFSLEIPYGLQAQLLMRFAEDFRKGFLNNCINPG